MSASSTTGNQGRVSNADPALPANLPTIPDPHPVLQFLEVDCDIEKNHMTLTQNGLAPNMHKMSLRDAKSFHTMLGKAIVAAEAEGLT